MNITNNGQATQGFHTKSGLVYIRPGETKDVDFASEVDFESARGNRYLGIEGVERKFSPTLDSLNFGESNLRDLLKNRDSELEQARSDLVLANSKVRELTDSSNLQQQELIEAQDRVRELEKQVEELRGDGGTAVTKYTSSHKGGGSYSVFAEDGAEVITKMTKDQSDEFNALDDVAKAAYVSQVQGQ